MESSQLAAAPLASSPRKRELESDPNADQKRPPKKLLRREDGGWESRNDEGEGVASTKHT